MHKITIDLPDFREEVSELGKFTTKLKKEIINLKKIKTLNKYDLEYFDDKIGDALDYAGNLSTPAFNAEDHLLAMYEDAYPHSPHLARKLFHKHYGHIHHIYDKIKLRLYRLYDILEE